MILFLSEVSIYTSAVLYEVVTLEGNTPLPCCCSNPYYYLQRLFSESFCWIWKTSLITESHIFNLPPTNTISQFDHHIIIRFGSSDIQNKNISYSTNKKWNLSSIEESLLTLVIILKRKYSFESNDIEGCWKKTYSQRAKPGTKLKALCILFLGAEIVLMRIRF